MDRFVSTTTVQTSAIVVTLLIFVCTTWWNRRQSLIATNRQIYQALELASIKLFEFECVKANEELVRLVWFASHDDLKGLQSEPVKNFQAREYMCQMLNLFEMACRFCRASVFEPQ